MFTRSNNIEDGLGPTKSNTRSSAAESPVDLTDQQPNRGGVATATGLIWLRYLVSIILLASMIINLVQAALNIQFVWLTVIHAALVLCWFVYFPMMIWFTYTGRESKEVNAINEFAIILSLIALPVGSIILAGFQMILWQRDGTLGTSRANETERSSIIVTFAISSCQIAICLAWAGGLYWLVKGRNYEQGGQLRWKQTVHSLIRRQPVPRSW